jgi:hypothetical protein
MVVPVTIFVSKSIPIPITITITIAITIVITITTAVTRTIPITIAITIATTIVIAITIAIPIPTPFRQFHGVLLGSHPQGCSPVTVPCCPHSYSSCKGFALLSSAEAREQGGSCVRCQ